MNLVMQFVKKKIILFALIVGLIYVLPHILFIFEEGKDYHLFFKTNEDSELYASRVREIYDGHYLISDPFIYENKHKPYNRTFLSEYLAGTLGKIFGLSIDNLFVLGDFIFPIIVFYLLFYFLNLLVRSPSLSLVGSMVILLAEFPYSLYLLFKLNIIGNFLTFSRPISPQFHYIFFVSCLIFIYRSLVNEKGIDTLLAGLFLGLLFYVYPYFWSYIFAGLGVLFLYLLFKKNFPQAKIIFFIFIEAILISIPFWINYLRLINLPFYNEIITRIAQRSYHILVFKEYILTLIIIIFILFYKNKDFKFFFLLSLLVGGLLCMNQQVITGWAFEPFHWHHLVNKQMTVITGIVILERLIRTRRFKEKFIRVFFIIGLTFSISMGIIIQVYSYEKNKYIQHQQQDLYEAFVWLQNNTEKEDVVLTSGPVSLLIPAYTHNNVYWSSYIFEYANSDKEILERFFLLAKLLGMEEGEVIDYILTSRERGHSDFFGGRYGKPIYKKYSQGEQDTKVKLPKYLHDYIIQRYRTFKKEDMKTVLTRFRVDYLFYSPYERLLSKGRLKKEKFLDKVYDSGDIQVYKIKNEN